MKTLQSVLFPILTQEDSSSTNYAIASYILLNAQQLHHVTSTDLSKACNVSKASISRFCKQVGLDDFYTLKYLIKQHVVLTQPNWEGNLFKSFQTDITRIEKALSLSDIKELVGDVAQSSKVMLMGTLETYSTIINLQKQFLELGKMTQVSVSPCKQEELFASQNLVLVFSQNKDYLGSVFKKLAIKGNPKIYYITPTKHVSYSYVYKTIAIGAQSTFAFHTFGEIILNEYKKYLYEKMD